jgi:hypothetical protein
MRGPIAGGEKTRRSGSRGGVASLLPQLLSARKLVLKSALSRQ